MYVYVPVTKTLKENKHREFYRCFRKVRLSCYFKKWLNIVPEIGYRST